MLGKTNITTLSESGIVTEIEDYRWMQMESGTYADFVKAFYKNGYLAAITADGHIVYTVDGEMWRTAEIDHPGCKINDIDWDGSRFILVGCCTDTGSAEGGTIGLAVRTSDFQTFERLPTLYYGSSSVFEEYIFVVPMNGRYAMAAVCNTSLSGIWTDFSEEVIAGKLQMGVSFPLRHHAVAKNSSGALAYVHGSSASTIYHGLFVVRDGEMGLLKPYNLPNVRAIAPFECKDILYFQQLRAEENYSLSKLTGSGEVMSVATGQDFGFTDAVYFNECQLFINAHEMLVVRKGESLSDKTTDDLIEIAPELTMQCIVKAFDQLYIFGSRGLILRSSVETDNEEVIVVQALSAKRALAESKAYTDARYKELEARIAALGG